MFSERGIATRIADEFVEGARLLELRTLDNHAWSGKARPKQAGSAWPWVALRQSPLRFD
jgi:hypothetical protein